MIPEPIPNPLLEVSALTVDYHLGKSKMRALDRVTFTLDGGEVIGVAGESGCGKSTLGLSIIGLLPRVAEVKRGEILFNGRDLLRLSEDQLNREIRGQKISMIFQNPQYALNPVFRIETQMIDILRFQRHYRKRHRRLSRAKLRQEAVRQLKETGIADPEERISSYPHEFSGGMKQRVMIAMALSSQTSLLIADEPTTALDVTIEAQILKLIRDLTARYGTSVLYISHDLGILSEISNRIIIMYAGRVLEMGPTAEILDSPRHPYSSALLESLPSRHQRGEKLLTIPGYVPSLDRLPPGCAFHPRCRFREDRCMREVPKLVEVSPQHWSCCLLDQKRGRQKWQWI